MKPLIITLSILGLTFFTQAAQSSVEPILNNHDSIDYGSSISPNGEYLYFSHAASDFSDRHLMQATLKQGKITGTTKLLMAGQPMSGGDIQISPNGKTLVFYSRTSLHRDPTRKDGDLFYSHKTNAGWSKPHPFPDTVNSDQNEFYPVLTHSGNLYFARENTATSYDLYVSEFKNDRYQQATKLNNKINTDLLESDAYIAPDESFMVFVRMNEDGAFGVSDLYISFNSNNGWLTPRNLGKTVNFEGVDGSPFVTQNRQWLYFTSNRDAKNPKEFDGHLGVFRIKFAKLLSQLSTTQKYLSYHEANQQSSRLTRARA